MTDWEAALRLSSFLLVFTVFALLEWWRPFRPAERRRWASNLGLSLLGTLLLRLVFPVAATGVALWASAQGVGVANQLALPLLVSVPLGILLLDMLIYWQHRLFHRIPWLWRLHRVHHADLAVDVSTGLRFHPVEFLLSMLIKAIAVALLGLPALAVLLFEVWLNACALFNHSNIALPEALERRLRSWLITPQLHRIHHSRRWQESQHNFGFSLSCWDRFFGSFQSRAQAGNSVQLGLPELRQLPQGLWFLLWSPFERRKEKEE
ncbi:sterol desaturase family protein [Spongiibacter tropicus]|uniref:sterol desaturase family protein n=1 Tax=Spongiibacter tropicus TaxID=454602 RepID=UPI0035BE43D1